MENFVVVNQTMIHLQKLGEIIQKNLKLFKKFIVQIGGNPADTHIILGHAGTADFAHGVQQILPLLKRIEHSGYSAEVHNITADTYHIACNSHHFRRNHADILSTERHFYARQFFNRHTVSHAVAHTRQIIQAVGIRNCLIVSSAFQQLFNAAVQITDFGVGMNAGFAVHFHQKTQNTVGTGVLRS